MRGEQVPNYNLSRIQRARIQRAPCIQRAEQKSLVLSPSLTHLRCLSSTRLILNPPWVQQSM